MYPEHSAHWPCISSVRRVVLACVLTTLGALALTASPAFAERTFDTQITGAGASTIAVDGADNVWVSSQHFISEFDRSGTLLSRWTNEGAGFPSPFGFALSNSTGDAYIGEGGQNRVAILDSSGTFSSSFGVNGGQGNNLWVAVDNSGGPSSRHVYVAVDSTFNVQAFDESGNPVSFSAAGEPGKTYIKGNTLTGTPSGRFGKEELSFFVPPAVATDADGNIYVVDRVRAVVDEFDHTGTFVRAFNGAGAPGGFAPAAEEERGLIGVAVDPTNGNVLILESKQNVIDEFSQTGAYLGQITGTSANSPFGSLGDLLFGGGIAVDSKGVLFVSDRGKQVVDVFTPNGPAPILSYGPVSNAAQASVTLNATVDPNGGPSITQCHFQYIDDATFEANSGSYSSGAASVPCSPNPAATPPASNFTVPTAVSADLTGLAPGTTYDYRIVVENSAGVMRHGSDQTFTPQAVGGVSTDPASDITRTSATLNGSFTGDGNDTHYYFEWGTDTSYGNTTAVPPGIDAGSPIGPQSLSFELSGLELGTAYHYRLVTENKFGITRGEDEEFRTLGAVEYLTTEPATNVTTTSATLNGSFTGDGNDTHYYFEYGKTTAYGHLTATPPGLDQGTAVGTQNVSANIEGLVPGSAYHFRVVAGNVLGTSVGADETFTTASPPAIDAFSSSNVTATSADLGAQINPHGVTATYRFEYGTTTAYGESAPVPDAEISEELFTDHSVTVHLTGLQGVTYHFRVIATNKWGTTTTEDQTFEFFPPNCPNSAVRQQTGSAYLPDCRAYELVSPANANGTLLFAGGPNTGQATGPSRFSFTGAFSALPGADTINTAGDLYVSSRSAEGWVSHYVGLRGDEAGCMGGPPNLPTSFAVANDIPMLTNWVAADPSMTHFLSWVDGAPVPCFFGTNGASDATNPVAPPSNAPYLFGADGSLLGRLPTSLGDMEGSVEALACPYQNINSEWGICSSDVAPSADLSHLAFSSNKLAFAEAGLTEAPGSAYDNNLAAGTVSLISVLPNGENIPQDPAFANVPPVISGPQLTRPGGEEEFIRFPAISSDGSHILMSTATQGTPFCSKGSGLSACPHYTESPLHLDMRIDDAVTFEIAKGRAVEFVGMTADGSRVYFTTAESLVSEDQDSSSDLYMWTQEGAENGSPLTLISRGENPASSGEPGNTDGCSASWTTKCGVVPYSGYSYSWLSGGVGGNGISDSAIASANGDIYFYSPEQLVGDQGVPGQQNLYDYRNGRAQFVATLHPEKHCVTAGFGEQICSDGPVVRLEVSPDDSHMAFLTASQLTSYDNAGHLEMYSYTPSTGSIVCDSCRPDGRPATADVQASEDGLFMTDDGRAFFSTSDPLVPQDTNEGTDVYEFTGGRPQLITPGTGTASQSGGGGFGGSIVGVEELPGLVGVSANGNDVYFATFDSLISEDHNGNFFRFYDARTNGGFPLAPPAPPCAAAEECHGPGSVTPEPLAQGTAARLSGGNSKPRKHHRKKRHKKKATGRHHRQPGQQNQGGAK
jgi:hypothetical protein